jgi:hypothetical protein
MTPFLIGLLLLYVSASAAADFAVETDRVRLLVNARAGALSLREEPTCIASLFATPSTEKLRMSTGIRFYVSIR